MHTHTEFVFSFLFLNLSDGSCEVVDFDTFLCSTHFFPLSNLLVVIFIGNAVGHNICDEKETKETTKPKQMKH